MKLSVIIPSYNSLSTIERCLESVIRELETVNMEWEIIVVNDGSSDNSPDLIRQIIVKYKERNIRLIEQLNGGAATARNTGIKVAKGKYIAFNDSDDQWFEGKVVAQIGYLDAHRDVMMIGCGYNNQHKVISKVEGGGEDQIINIKRQVLKNYFQTPTVMVRREVIDIVGLMNQQQRYSEDGNYYNRVVYNCKSVFVDLCVAGNVDNKYSWGQAGLSGNLWKMEKGELFNICQAYNDNFINFYWFLFAYIFSFAKYLRRVIITLIRS